MTDTIHTVTLTPQEQAAFESGRKIGWNEGIEAAARSLDERITLYGDETNKVGVQRHIRALSMPPPAQAWRVKPLEWITFQTSDGKARWKASTPFGKPYIADERGWWHVIEPLNPCDGLDEAKASAQADYAACILAALIPDTEAGA